MTCKSKWRVVRWWCRIWGPDVYYIHIGDARYKNCTRCGNCSTRDIEGDK